MRKIKKYLLFFSVFLSSLIASCCTSAQEVAVITKTELEQSLIIVNSLEASSRNKTQLLEKQKKQIEKLETQLSSSQNLNSQMKLELQNLNASFKEYSEECKKQLHRVKTQRTVAYMVIAGLTYAYIKEIS